MQQQKSIKLAIVERETENTPTQNCEYKIRKSIWRDLIRSNSSPPSQSSMTRCTASASHLAISPPRDSLRTEQSSIRIFSSAARLSVSSQKNQLSGESGGVEEGIVELASDSGESQPDLGYLFEASDDELGIPPPAATPARKELVTVKSDSSELGGELWEDEWLKNEWLKDTS